MVGEPEGKVGKGHVCGYENIGFCVHLCEIVHTDMWVPDAYSGGSILIAKVTVYVVKQ